MRHTNIQQMKSRKTPQMLKTKSNNNNEKNNSVLQKSLIPEN